MHDTKLRSAAQPTARCPCGRKVDYDLIAVSSDPCAPAICYECLSLDPELKAAYDRFEQMLAEAPRTPPRCRPLRPSPHVPHQVYGSPPSSGNPARGG